MVECKKRGIISHLREVKRDRGVVNNSTYQVFPEISYNLLSFKCYLLLVMSSIPLILQRCTHLLLETRSRRTQNEITEIAKNTHRKYSEKRKLCQTFVIAIVATLNRFVLLVNHVLARQIDILTYTLSISLCFSSYPCFTC